MGLEVGLCKRNSVLNVALALNYPNHTTLGNNPFRLSQPMEADKCIRDAMRSTETKYHVAPLRSAPTGVGGDHCAIPIVQPTEDQGSDKRLEDCPRDEKADTTKLTLQSCQSTIYDTYLLLIV